MKRSIYILIWVWVLCLFAGSDVRATDSILAPMQEEAAESVVAAWKQEDAQALNKAIMDLMTAEARLLAVEGDVESSYLSKLPESIKENDSAIGAFIWLTRQENRQLQPAAFFSGQSFCLNCSENRSIASACTPQQNAERSMAKATGSEVQRSAPEWSRFFAEDFSSGLKGWQVEKAGGDIAIYHSGAMIILQVFRADRHDFSYVRKDFTLDRDGNLRFEAMMASKKVVPGSKGYHRAKFQAALLENGKMVKWFADDFQGSTPWQKRVFHVLDLKAGQQVALRIGLQNAKGTVYCREIKGYFQPTE